MILKHHSEMSDDEKPKNFGIGRGIGPIATTAQLSNILNLTGARLSQLTQEGILRKEERGKYALCDAVNAYITYLHNAPKNQWGSKTEDDTDFDRERLRRTKEEADKLELANARTRGELVDVDKVKRLGEQVMSGIKIKILNMPLTDDEKDKCLRDLLSLKDLDYSDK
jgi:phage terminase Nu1 subunit (DNA packaging protein)